MMSRLLFYLVGVFLIMRVAGNSAKGLFSIEPENKVVPLKSTATITFNCKVEIPNPTYEWLKDGDQIGNSDNSRYSTFKGTLSIDKPEMGDEGKYQCMVTSDDGDIILSNYGTLTFAYINEFNVVDPNPIKKVEGHGFEVPCLNADYAPDKSVKFYWENVDDFNFIQMPGNPERYISPKSGSLYFSNPKTTDTSKYSCGARSLWKLNDKYERIQSNTLMKVVVKSSSAKISPEWLLQPQGVTYGVLGGVVMLECFAGGKPTPKITWTKTGGLTHTYTVTEAGQIVLTNITSEMAGTYICTATNSEGEIKSSGEVHMQYKPQWTDEIVSFNSDETISTKIHCSAAAEPSAVYTWLKDGKPVQNGNNTKVVGDSEGSILEIENVKISDKGIYQCIASNDLGTIFSSAKMTVNSYPPQFNVDAPDISQATVGSAAKVLCDVTASPSPTVTWTHIDGNGEALAISYNNIYSLEDEKHLIIENVHMADAGEYVCNASNVYKPSGVTHSSLLKVYEPNVMTTFPQNLTVTAGDDAELICGATFDSRLHLDWSWTQDGKIVVQHGEHYVVNGEVLMLRNVASGQDGVYECCAVSEVSKVCASATVDVKGPPGPPTDVQQTSVQITSSHLTWTMPEEDNGSPITNYIVFGKNQFEMETKIMTTHPSYINQSYCDILNLLPYNEYQYQVVAVNMYGISQYSALSKVSALTKSAAPMIAPSNVTGGNGVLGELVVIWEPLQPENYGAPKESVYYQVAVRKCADPTEEMVENTWEEYTEVGYQKSKSVISVSEDEIYVKYEAKVKALNSDGGGPYSEPVIVYTVEKAPTQAPNGFVMVTKKASWADISWNELEDTTGFTRRYDVRVCGFPTSEGCESWGSMSTKDEKPFIHIDNLKADHEYSISVAGTNSAGVGPFSEWWTFRTHKEPPQTAPANFGLTLYNDKVSAYWDPIQDYDSKIKGYVVQYWHSSKSNSDATSIPTINTKVDFYLPDSGSFNIQVRAESEGGLGTPSHIIAVSGDRGTKQEYTGGNADTIHHGKTILFSISLFMGVLYSL